MQLCNAEVRIADSPGHTVFKVDITPAEIIVLRAIHGEASVIDITPTMHVNRDSQGEFLRLQSIYGRSPEGLMNAGNGELLERIFPGLPKRLPDTLSDIGLGHLETGTVKRRAKIKSEHEDVNNGDILEAAVEGAGEGGGGVDA